MRQSLQGVGIPDHIGLAYDSWAPVECDGKVPDAIRAQWLADLAAIPTSPDYIDYFRRWKMSFHEPADRVFELELAHRMLVGHGNTSATEVGLTVHHTWGVPVIPGSALKGLVAHYVDAVYGGEEETRIAYRGVVWSSNKKRIQRGPGVIYREMFGAPDADEDEAMRERGLAAGASAGVVTFHDALYVPDSAPQGKPFAADVLTVHQKTYYEQKGPDWPNDYDKPIPVAFLTVRPRVKMLLALSGPADWTALAEQLLRDALDKWGVGGKTSVGYGRLLAPGQAATAGGVQAGVAAAPATSIGPRHLTGERITVTRIEDHKGKTKFRADDGIVGHFVTDPPQVGIGETVDVWVANVNPQAYTLTRNHPKNPLKGGRR